MTDHNTNRRTDLQGSIKEHHKQGSLHPADPEMLMSAGRGYDQKGLESAGRSSLSREQAGAPVQRALSGEGESRKTGGQRVIVPVVIAFVLGLLVAVLIFRIIYVPSSDTNESVAGAGEQEVSTEMEEETEMEEATQKEIVSEEDDIVDGLSSDTEDADTPSEDDNRDPGPISDSWEEIIAAGEDGIYIDKYKIGDTKELDLGEEGVIEMELVAFDADELADGSGKAHMTWITKDLLNTEHDMNADGTSEGGWPASDMRTWLRESILPLFPEEVRSNIKEVKKYSYFYFDYDDGTISSLDTIWIPSRREIFGEDAANEDDGPEYLTTFPDDASRIKQHIGVSEPSWWWLRSAAYANDGYFDNVDSDGSGLYINYADNVYGVAVGFCF